MALRTETVGHITAITAATTIIFGAGIPSVAVAGDGKWIMQAPGPYPTLNIPQIGFFGPDRGYMVGFNNADALVTTDGGETWSAAALPGNNYHALFFLDDQHGWLAGNDGVARTTDGGTTWEDLGFLNNGYEMHFHSPSFGWVSDNFAVSITHDGGLTWSPALVAGGQVVYPDFADPSVGVGIEDDDEALWRTTDGGATWTSVLQRPFNNFDEFHSVKFLDASTVLAVGYSTIFRSTDAGQTWSEVFGDPDLYLAGRITAFDDQTVLIDHFTVGFLSADGGATWSEIDFPHTVQYVTAAGGTELYGGNAFGEILHTTDAGQTWTMLYDGPEFPVSSFAFRPGDHIIAAGGNMMVESFDAGATWALTSSGSNRVVNDLVVSPATGMGFTAANDAVIGRTTNAGGQWVIQRELDFVNAWCVEMVTESLILVGGQQGWPKRSIDGGLTWTRIVGQSATAAVRDFDFLDEQVGWAAAGYSGTGHILKTDDGGLTWTIKEGPAPGGFRAIHVFDADTVAALHSENVVARTTDGGETWTLHALPNTAGVAMSFADGLTGWCAGDFGAIAVTDDGGVTWNVQLSGTTEHLTSVHAVNSTEAWVGGAYATLLHTTDGGQSWSTVAVDAPVPLIDPLHIYAIEVHDDGAMWIAGNGGVVLHQPGAAPSPGDVDGDGVVGTADLLALLAAWGPCANCPEDIDGDGAVSTADLLILLSSWG